MGNYIDNNCAKRDALKIIACYMTQKVNKYFKDYVEQDAAIEVCKEVFREVAISNEAPLIVVENFFGNLGKNEEVNTIKERRIYYTRIEVVDDILQQMS